MNRMMNFKKVNDYVFEVTNKVFQMMCERGFVYREPVLLARRIISDWDYYWDMDDIYEMISIVIYFEKITENLTVWDAFSVLYNCDLAVINSIGLEVINDQKSN